MFEISSHRANSLHPDAEKETADFSENADLDRDVNHFFIREIRVIRGSSFFVF